ncbi:MAG TPA: sulfatase-like hydrolase/transferase [Burkholderiales bacterium]|jgi:phosphoglycerol transferase MdoB-like AlkP superfamily enzyme|nr:sulfatase-like hydrolase/transferase [Burkholderiales bacterium]
MTEPKSFSPGASLLRGIGTAPYLGRFRPWLLLGLIYLAVSTLTRLVLIGVSMTAGQAAWADMPAVMAVGAVYDVVTALYLFTPFALYLALLPARLYHNKWQRSVVAGLFTATVFGLLYLGAVEFFFFDEFDARFNFVAVEYLIYPHEVFVNIWQSYPVAKVLIASAVLTVVVFLALRDRLFGPDGHPDRLRARLTVLVTLAAAIGAAQAGLTVNTGRYSENRVVNELAANGVYSFFNAAFHSDLDYPAYYLSLPDDEADERLRSLVRETSAAFFPESDHIERHISAAGAPKHLNVVVLLEESLGAEFVGAYGDTRGLTPNLDRLSKQSLLFANAFATGTRTVRGMEAVSASFPPVPAESIVKRPYNQGLFNWSTVMAKNGYAPTFIYGGYGTFDNMNQFFGSNGYRVIDRTGMDHPRFGNIWGVSDDDLFDHSIKVFDEQHARGERIFSIIMTTSNHKPFTFPPGVPGVPEKGGGRDAGIRYADHAIGWFLDAAQGKPWFENTLFVIVADHGARVYGREDIPVATYKIPLMFYSPKHVKPGKVDTLTSQIDVAPTVLGLLDFSYDSTFFGKDVLRDSRSGRFIPMNHNRDVALFNGTRIIEIGFRKTAAEYLYDPVTGKQTRVEIDSEHLKDAITVFQEAFELYKERLYRVASNR